jgi:hypothetical protein
VRGDARSRRIAVVPDHLANPSPGAPDALGALAEAGWGIVVLGPSGVSEAWHAAIVEQVAVFAADGYEIALVDPGDPAAQRFTRAFAEAGHAPARLLAP